MTQLNPKKLVFYITLIISFLQIVVTYSILCIDNIHMSILKLFVLFIFYFLLSYSIFSYILNKFIYKKIKLIYKSIRTVKSTKLPEKKSQNIIKEVEDEVTAWKKSQQKEIAQLKKMEKFRKEYIGNVSHELKTPIFNIQGYLESLANMPDKNSEIFKSFLKKAINNTERLNTIVRDLEMISKSETGQLQLQWTLFPIRELIETVYKEFEIQAERQKILLKFKLGKCPGFQVYADKERIYQVLTNLISNAIKYNRPDGKVIASCYDMADHILIEITDTGIGIKQKHLSRLFERFYRIDKNRSRKKGGSGLGLAIVKHILEAHHQNVHVRSKYGTGTTFGFTLPKKY